MNALAYFKGITTFVFDVDGVLTDGTVLLLENGLQARQMHVKDGLALQMAVKNGYKVIVVSGGTSAPVKDRLHYLGLQDIYIGVKDKVAFLQEHFDAHQLIWKEVLYMGDDLPDIPVLQKVALPCCPADAVQEVKKIAAYISNIKGGYGCVRDVIEKTLKLNGHWKYSTEVTSK